MTMTVPDSATRPGGVSLKPSVIFMIVFIAFATGALWLGVTKLQDTGPFPPDVAGVDVRNDAGLPVTMIQCEDPSCRGVVIETRQTIAPGQVGGQNVQPGISGDNPNVLLVTTPGSPLRRSLSIPSTLWTDSRWQVSQATPCPA